MTELLRSGWGRKVEAQTLGGRVFRVGKNRMSSDWEEPQVLRDAGRASECLL